MADEQERMAANASRVPADPIPNPGTRNALDQGCTCPVLDNNHGMFPVYHDEAGEPQWYITSGCPLHHKGSLHDRE